RGVGADEIDGAAALREDVCTGLDGGALAARVFERLHGGVLLELVGVALARDAEDHGRHGGRRRDAEPEVSDALGNAGDGRHQTCSFFAACAALRAARSALRLRLGLKVASFALAA